MNEIINKAETLLKEKGFTQADYVISLQGPTIILTESGQIMMTPGIQKELTETGIKTLQLI
jgi:ABC-type transport system substrate-binding protein